MSAKELSRECLKKVIPITDDVHRALKQMALDREQPLMQLAHGIFLQYLESQERMKELIKKFPDLDTERSFVIDEDPAELHKFLVRKTILQVAASVGIDPELVTINGITITEEEKETADV